MLSSSPANRRFSFPCITTKVSSSEPRIHSLDEHTGVMLLPRPLPASHSLPGPPDGEPLARFARKILHLLHLLQSTYPSQVAPFVAKTMAYSRGAETVAILVTHILLLLLVWNRMTVLDRPKHSSRNLPFILIKAPVKVRVLLPTLVKLAKSKNETSSLQFKFCLILQLPRPLDCCASGSL